MAYVRKYTGKTAWMLEDMRASPDNRIFFFNTAALAQGLRMGQWSGDIQLLGDYARTDSESSGVERMNENTRTEERLTLRNAGAYITDPRFITFSLGGTFGLSQEQSTAEADGQEFRSEERDAELIGYDASVGFFSDSAWSLSLFGNRNKYVQLRELTGRNETDVQNSGATVYAKRLYIPSTLTLRQERTEEESRVADVATLRDETRNIITYNGRRGWVDSEMNLRYERVEKSDEIRPELDYDSQTASMFYSLDFGAELNRRWDSRIRGYERSGFSEENRWDLDQLLRIDHSSNLRTQYRYFLTDTQRPQGDSTNQTAEFSARHQLYESLTTEFRGNAIRQDLTGGKREVNAGRLSLDYTKRLLGSGRLRIGLAGYYAKEDSQFDAVAAQFVQESHIFDSPFARPVTLDNPFVIESSVIINRTAVGATSGCDIARPLSEGIDYELRAVGDTTEIVPLGDCLVDPTVGIGPGDTIAVDYQAEVPQQLAFTSTSWRLNGALDFRWIRPYFIHDERRQKLDDGDPQQERFLQDRQSDIVGVELRYSGPSARANVSFETERFRSRNEDYERVRGNEFLQYHMSRHWRLSVTGRQSLTKFSAPEDRQTEILEARAVLRHTASASLYTEFLARWWSIDDTLVPDEEVQEASVQLRWRLGKLEVDPHLRYINRKRDGTTLQDYRALVRVIRRF